MPPFPKESLMFRPKHVTRFMVVAIAALAAACASQKEPAEKALAELEGSLAKISEQAEKYMPEEYAEVSAQLAGLKASYDGGDYKSVVTAAPKAAAAIRKLQADAIIAKADLAKKMTEEWGEIANTVPDQIAAVDKQIVRYTSRGGTPKGLNRDEFKQLVASFDAAKEAWGQAGEAGNAGKYEEAVTAAREVKQVIDSTMQALGMSGAG